MNTPPHAVIAGAGGGLSLAPSLHAAGITCEVYEAASEIKPVGDRDLCHLSLFLQTDDDDGSSSMGCQAPQGMCGSVFAGVVVKSDPNTRSTSCGLVLRNAVHSRSCSTWNGVTAYSVPVRTRSGDSYS